MTAQLIDGKAIAAQIYEEIQAEVAELKEKHGITPGLATVLVGENPASQSYVRSKQKTHYQSKKPCKNLDKTRMM